MPIEKHILEEIETNPNLSHISLAYQNFQSADMQILFKALANHPNIVSLDLTGNLLSLDTIQQLADNTTLQSLNVSGCKINAEGAKLLAKNMALKKLILNYNQIGDEGAIALGNNNSLTRLEVSDNHITDIGAKGLSANRILTSLVVNSNQIGTEGAISLAKNSTLTSLIAVGNLFMAKGALAFLENSSLIYLDISYNQIGDEGAIALAQNKSLRELVISYNEIGKEGASAFEHNQTLQSLNIAGNNASELGAVAIARNNTLKVLIISNNQIDDIGTEAFAHNQSITDLDISYNYVFAEGAEHLAKNKRLKKLNLSHNPLGDNGVIEIAALPELLELDITRCDVTSQGALALASSPSLNCLRMSLNYIDNEGAIALSQSTTLRHLFISYNYIGDEGAIALAQNHKLSTLALNYNPIRLNGVAAVAQNPAISTLIPQTKYQSQHQPISDLKKLFLMTQNFLCVTNIEGIIQFFNPALPRTLGYNADELLGQSLIKFLHPDDHALKVESINQKVEISIFENRYLCHDGSFHIIQWKTQRENDVIYAIGQDITEQRKAERKLLEREHQSQLVHIQQAALLREKQTEFIAHLCHEVRNPLNGIYGYLELLEDHMTKMATLEKAVAANIDSAYRTDLEKQMTEVKEILVDMGICAEHQKAILDNNLDASMIEANKLKLDDVSAFDPKEVIQAAVKMVKARALQKKINLNIDLPEMDFFVKGDAYRFKQIVLNLLGNAIKFTEKGQVKIGLNVTEQSDQDCHLIIKVKDTGIGMTEGEITTKLFKRFSQANTAVGGQYGGSGLGLYITKRLIELMGGEIEVKSQKGQGSTFQFGITFKKFIPQAQKQEEQVIAEPSPNSLSVFQSKKYKILMVDDNLMNQKILASMLTKAGQEYVIAANGQEAFEKFQQAHFDLIFMDIEMPIMNGLEATRKIREQEKTRNLHIPIIGLSGNARSEQVQEALDAGMDGYLTKPYKKQDIYAMIEKYTQPEVLAQLLKAANKSSNNTQIAPEKKENTTQLLAHSMQTIWGYCKPITVASTIVAASAVAVSLYFSYNK